jgi:uracil-DNA glycosylase
MRDDDRPKLLGNSDAVRERLAQIDLPHVSPLTRFVRKLRSDVGAEGEIPWFDPWDGGVNAEVLFLLEAPGGQAVRSGFVSRNNPDETAKNFYELNEQAGLLRQRTAVWNVVPWYIGSGSKIRPANLQDIREGMKTLGCLLKLLPELRAVVLLGRKAQRVGDFIAEKNPRLRVFTCPHPSPLYVRIKPENQAMILRRLEDVRSFLD